MLYQYPCNLKQYEDGEFVVSFPDVPEALTGARDREEALTLAEDALSVALAGYVHLARAIPVPSAAEPGLVMVAVYPVVAAKLALYSLMRERHITKVALAELLGVSEAAVRKLMDPDHRSHIGQVERALRLLGSSLAVQSPAA